MTKGVDGPCDFRSGRRAELLFNEQQTFLHVCEHILVRRSTLVGHTPATCQGRDINPGAVTRRDTKLTHRLKSQVGHFLPVFSQRPL